METFGVVLIGGSILLGASLFALNAYGKRELRDDTKITALSDYDKIVATYTKYFGDFSPEITLNMLLRMWEIESQKSNPNFMFRSESGLAQSQKKWSLYNGTGVDFDDASLGALQVLTGTANWLYTDMGYKAEGKPTLENLKNDAKVNTYFAMAYLDWLAKRAHREGRVVTERFLVMSYNGGYGANNSQTNNHYTKYLNVEMV